jgi:hypothetical protein
LDAAAPMLQRQQTRKASPVLFVQGDKHTVDRAMVLGQRPVRVTPATRTFTVMDNFPFPLSGSGHRRSSYLPLLGQDELTSKRSCYFRSKPKF